MPGFRIFNDRQIAVFSRCGHQLRPAALGCASISRRQYLIVGRTSIPALSRATPRAQVSIGDTRGFPPTRNHGAVNAIWHDATNCSNFTAACESSHAAPRPGGVWSGFNGETGQSRRRADRFARLSERPHIGRNGKHCYFLMKPTAAIAPPVRGRRAEPELGDVSLEFSVNDAR
jgi:hypothetical protein